MNSGTARVDIANSPELARLAEDVHASKQPRYLEKDGEALVMVTPVASKRTHRLAATAAEAEAEAEAEVEVNGMERVRTELTLPPPPLPEAVARRQALMRQILVNQERRVISPLTTADLVREVREEEYRSYDDRT
jgi:hypothetical protein